MTTIRPQPIRQDSEVHGEDAPPPAYEAVASTTGEVTLDIGPSRPFQPVQPATNHYINQQSPSNSTLPPPIFPFWNGSSLTAQQTGFNPNSNQQQHQHQQYSHYNSSSSQPPHQQQQYSSHPPPPHHPSTQQQHQQYQSVPQANQYPPPQQQYAPPLHPPSASTSTSTPSSSTNAVKPTYAPTTVATPGQPLLNKGKLLVFPLNKPICPKCLDTGYKSNDPSHPCRKCWEKYGKTFSPVIIFAPETNLQKPLRNFSSSSTQRPSTQQMVPNGYPGSYSQSHHNSGNYQQQQQMGMAPRPLVVYPGDPRIGGQLCRACGGAGSFNTGFSFFGDSYENCHQCRGSGRVFI